MKGGRMAMKTFGQPSGQLKSSQNRPCNMAKATNSSKDMALAFCLGVVGIIMKYPLYYFFETCRFEYSLGETVVLAAICCTTFHSISSVGDFIHGSFGEAEFSHSAYLNFLKIVSVAAT